MLKKFHLFADLKAYQLTFCKLLKKAKKWVENEGEISPVMKQTTDVCRDRLSYTTTLIGWMETLQY